jgi:hypothetical protein
MLDGSMVQMPDAPNQRPGNGGCDLRGGGAHGRPESALKTAPKMAESAPKRGAPETHARARPLRGEEPSGRPEDRGGPSGPPRLRGGSLEQGKGVGASEHRQIVLEDQPAPYCMSDREAAQAASDGHAGRMARQAGQMAEECAQYLDQHPEAPRLRRLQRDPLVMLFNDGVLHLHQVTAGQEIARVFAIWTQAVGARVSAAYGERTDRSPEPDLPEALRIASTERYRPWRVWAGAVGVNARKSLADLTLLVCVDGLGARQVGDLLSMDQRTVVRRLQESLHWYARNAGWLSDRQA